MQFPVVCTYNPAILKNRRDPNLAVNIQEHMALVRDMLNGVFVDPADVNIAQAAPPLPSSPPIISIDIETYGAVKRDFRGLPMPSQTVFNPIRSLHQDRVPRESVIQAVSITPAYNPNPLGLDLRDLEAQPTMVFLPFRPDHRLWLQRWLSHAHTLLGTNLPFDISYLRRCLFPRSIRPETHLLIDLMAVNYLHCEVRLERSLKSLSLLLGTHRYEEDEGKFDDPENRFPNPLTPRRKDQKTLSQYAAEDTHATLLTIVRLAQRIHEDYPDTVKLSPECLSFFSDVVWCCVRLTETGVCYSYSALRSLEERLRLRLSRVEAVAAGKYDLLLRKTGSKASRRACISAALQAVDNRRFAAGQDQSILEDPRLQFTEKEKEVSTDDINRNLFLLELEPSSKEARALRLFDKHNAASKTLGTFIYPLLYHQRQSAKNTKSLAIASRFWDRPSSPEQVAKALTEENKRTLKKGKKKVDADDIGISPAAPPPTPIITYPTWFPVPSFSEGSDDGGGTQQGRITGKNHSVQTDPPVIQECYASRFPRGLPASIDLSQIELRIAGVLSGEPSIVSAYIEGRDLHSERAVSLMGHGYFLSLFGEAYLKNPHFKSDWRQPAKTFNFGDLFWAAGKTLQIQVLKMTGKSIPIEICERVVATRPHVRPVLYQWQCALIRKAAEQHYIELPFTGQSRLFLGSREVIEDTYASTVINFPVQCTAANVLHSIYRELVKILPAWDDPKAWVLITCNKYDALYFDLRLPRYLDDLHEAWEKAIRTVEHSGYYARICEHYKTYIPLRYEMKATGHKTRENILR